MWRKTILIISMTVSSRLDWNPAAKRFLQHCGCSSNKRMVIEILLTKTCQVQVVGDKHTHTHTQRLTALFPGLPRWAGTSKVKQIWILLKQETVSGSGISWTICKCAPRSRQITTPAPHHSVFYRLDALPAAQPTASKHWRHKHWRYIESTWNSLKTPWI